MCIVACLDRFYYCHRLLHTKVCVIQSFLSTSHCRCLLRLRVRWTVAVLDPQDAPRVDGPHRCRCHLCAPEYDLRFVLFPPSLHEQLMLCAVLCCGAVEHLLSNMLPLFAGPFLMGSVPAWLD